MGIHVALEHSTTYRFDRPVKVQPHAVRLRPAPHTRTPISAYDLKVEPSEHFVNWQQDPFGNFIARLAFPEPTQKLVVAVNLVADLTVINPFDFFINEESEHYSFDYEAQLKNDLSAYLQAEQKPPGPLVSEWLTKVPKADGTLRTVDFLVELNQRLANDISYSIRMEPGVQSPEETLQRGVGSCRDSAWLFVQILRHLGLAARFVSGYLVQLRSDQPSLDGPDGPEADFTDLHAWTEVYVPGAGWIGLDPTSGLFAGEGHIPLAATPHPNSAAPITGTTEPCAVEFSFENRVTRIREDPRVTLPYSEAAWNSIEQLAHKVDDRLTAGDVRLTMGGEPTFVSIDDMEGAEWNFDADGEAKRNLAEVLTGRLAKTFAAHGLVQYGEGKWYPGEDLPRWRNTIFWRLDGQPLWRQRDLLATATTEGTATRKTLESFVAQVANSFGVANDFVLQVFEDPVPKLWAEAKTPAGTAPPEVDASWFENEARQNAAEIADFAGLVLPIHTTASGWGTSRWKLRRGQVYAAPGDSPIGLRLPLDSLTWSETPNSYEQPVFEVLEELPLTSSLDPTARVVPVDAAPSTALCFEIVDGHISVFLPPLESIEHALHLLAVLEAAAQQTAQPLHFAGYPLPRHPRICSLSVTPDPGVIEVNVHPAASWDELSETTSKLYEDARLARLGTEKFALDGKHTGTGGGNHVTLGGPTPADSPLLRRPDLLRSLLTFWQRHPSLSYVFSGQFIGPTSQAPRIDEARHDSLYELEISFAQLHEHSKTLPTEVDVAPLEEFDDAEAKHDGDGAEFERLAGSAKAKPWLVDRLFRNVLTDLTGNTHRAEFCIDKLYNPDSDTGRLGLLELRAFEMPPHHQMALVQALLVRSLVARFWEDAYTADLVRWGSQLHNQFMLSSRISQDLHEVVADLRAHGIDFEHHWLDPFMEFRFPILGECEIDGISLKLRSAIEPWHVLAEQKGDGTSRYVDSSVERVELIATGFSARRHLIAVNGHPLPLTSVAPNQSQSVAGVRFKAWSPPSSLHPTIKPQSPLRFDVVDVTTGKSLGGFTYHSTHPGGRSYDTFPVNQSEAEARRVSRFSSLGREARSFDVAAMMRQVTMQAKEYSGTLDLRCCYPRDLYLLTN